MQVKTAVNTLLSTTLAKKGAWERVRCYLEPRYRGMLTMYLLILTLPLDADGGGCFTASGLWPYAGQAGVRPA
jgi:hypothetical protein